MAVVTLTVAQLAAALRLGSSTEETDEATRLLAYSSEAVLRHAPSATDTALNEAAIRLSGYLYDQPNAGRGLSFAHALRNSGAAAILLPYRIHRAGSTGEAIEAAQQAVGTVGNPVIGVSVSGSDLIISFADGTTQTDPLPAGGGGGMFSGTDQTARDAAAAAQAEIDAHEASTHNHDQTARDSAQTAQTTADSKASQTDFDTHTADPDAHHVPPMGGGGVVSESTRLPLGTVVMRLGWAQSQAVDDSIFTRANLHPTDGAAEGTVAGLSVPPFPPALNTDPNLYFFIWIAAPAVNIADIILSGGGGTLSGTVSNGAAFTYDGVDGTFYVSNQRLSPGLSAYQIRAVVAGALIASQPWVTEQIAAIPAPTGGGGEPEPLGTADLTIVSAPLFHATGLTLPSDKTWAYVSMGTHDEESGGTTQTYAAGPWLRLLIADLLGLADITTATTPTTANAIHSEVEIQNFRELDLGTAASGEILVSLPHKNAGSTITGPLRVMVS